MNRRKRNDSISLFHNDGPKRQCVHVNGTWIEKKAKGRYPGHIKMLRCLYGGTTLTGRRVY